MNSDQVFIHPQGLVDPGARVGRGTRIWAFAHVAAGAVVGEDCNLCDHTFVEGKVRIGNRVTLKCGVYLWDGVEAKDDVFVGPNATFTNDLRPRSRQRPEEYARTLLERGCSIGAGAILLPGLTIGRWSLVGAGAVVTRPVHDYALVVGNPAKLQGWVCQCGQKLQFLNAVRTQCACGRSFERLAQNQIQETTL